MLVIFKNKMSFSVGQLLVNNNIVMTGAFIANGQLISLQNIGTGADVTFANIQATNSFSGPNMNVANLVSNQASISSITGSSCSFHDLYTTNIESFSSTLNIASQPSITSTVNVGTSSSTQTINIGTVGNGSTTINLGGVGDTVNVAGDLVYVNSTITEITNPYFIINQGNPNIQNTGIIVSKTGVSGDLTGAYLLVNATSDGWITQAGNGVIVNLNQDIGIGASPSFSQVNTTNLTINNMFTGSLASITNLQSNNANVSILTGSYASISSFKASNATVTSQLYLNSTNVHLGLNAGQTSQNSLGVAIGNYAGQTSQSDSIAIGNYAANNTQGSKSIAIGDGSAQNNQGTNSIAVGVNAAFTSQGTQNVAIGYGAANTRQGPNCVALGASAGYQDQGTGSGNGYAVAIGNSAGATNQRRYGIAIGNSAGNTNQGEYATAYGHYAGRTGQGNYAVAIGALAGDTNQAANSIILNASGIALDNSSTSGLFVSPVRTIGMSTGCIGYNTTTKELAYSNTATYTSLNSSYLTVDSNIMVGYVPSKQSTTTALGFQAGFNTVSAGAGIRNAFVGYQAGLNNTTGGYNTFIGGLAGHSNTIGETNTFVGTVSGLNNTAGKSNTCLGYASLYYNTSGIEHTAIGMSSLYNCNTSSTAPGNTAIGLAAGSVLTTGYNCSFVGYNAQPSIATAVNEITLGDNNISVLRCQATTITSVSDARDKTNISDMEPVSDFLQALHPVQFVWNDRQNIQKRNVPDYGFIAQECQQAQQNFNKEWVNLVYNANPDKLEMSATKLVPLLVKGWQEQQQTIQQLINSIKHASSLEELKTSINHL